MCFAVLLVRVLMHEFARISQAIIHGAAQSEKRPLNNLGRKHFTGSLWLFDGSHGVLEQNQLRILDCRLGYQAIRSFKIRNPQSEIRNTKCSITPTLQPVFDSIWIFHLMKQIWAIVQIT